MKVRSFGGLLLVLLLPGYAAAQEPADIERAKQSFNAGATAYAAGEYLAAIQALDGAYALTPLPAIAFSLAQAERKQYFVDHQPGHLDRAIELFRRYLEQVPSGGRRIDAVDAIAQLEPLAAVQTTAGAGAHAAAGDPERHTRLMITSDAPAAQVSLDGGPRAPSPLIREVEPGKHRAEVTADGFYPAELDLTAVAGELIPTAVPLREQPSTIAVWSARDAQLYVDGAYVGQGGDSVAVHLPSGSHRLDVTQKGYRISSQMLELRRGQTENITVTLVPTAQRRAAQALLVSGGAALGVGLVFGGLALRAQSRAQEFLDRREHGNVSSDDLSEYQSTTSDRGRYRAGAAISLASSAGLFLTGFFLFELDQPNVQEFHRAGRLPGAGRQGRAPGPRALLLGVEPLPVPNGLGMSIRARF